MKKRQVEITGMGILGSVGKGILDFQQSLHQGRAHFTRQEQAIVYGQLGL